MAPPAHISARPCQNLMAHPRSCFSIWRKCPFVHRSCIHIQKQRTNASVAIHRQWNERPPFCWDVQHSICVSSVSPGTGLGDTPWTMPMNPSVHQTTTPFRRGGIGIYQLTAQADKLFELSCSHSCSGRLGLCEPGRATHPSEAPPAALAGRWRFE